MGNNSVPKFIFRLSRSPVYRGFVLGRFYCILLLATKIQSTKKEIVSGKNKIWVSTDETSDVDGRFVANVVVGTLKREQHGEIFLLACEVLERVNNSSIAVVFDNAMNLLWPDKVERENVLLFVSDAAPYMIKAAKALQLLYPN